MSDINNTESREYVVRTKELQKHYMLGVHLVKALDGVTIDIFKGEYLSIMGPSGSGKSTLFNMVGGLDKPDGGSVFINDTDMAQLSASELAYLRCHTIGYIFQSFNLIPVMTALENVTLPMIFAGLTSEEAMDKGSDLLALVGLGERLNHKPTELSGGQQQRVAIARSLANDPSIVLADEPTGNLDMKTGEEIIKLLKDLNEKKGVTIITATHDTKMLDISDRIVWIRDGKIFRIQERSEVDINVAKVNLE